VPYVPKPYTKHHVIMLNPTTCNYPYHNFPQLTAVNTAYRLVQQDRCFFRWPLGCVEVYGLADGVMGYNAQEVLVNYFTPPWTYNVIITT
jgi:hypothetical protein